jgi:lipoprotein-anchoring transpeptidase ErfK/SrfK
VVVALATLAVGCASGRPTTSPPGTVPTTGPPAPATSAPATTVPATTTLPPATAAPATTTPPPPTAAPVSTLARGSSGPAVTALQQRLSALGYWLGPVDGQFGDATQQAVYALQKAAGISRDGVVGPVTSAALDRGVRPHPRSTAGSVIEIDLRAQLLMLVRSGTLRYALNTSTGGDYVYTSDGVTSVASTPVGHFTVYRQVDGLDISPLGELWRPKYFYAGYAVHGYDYVPPVPVSHGCVRLSNEAINWIWAEGLAPIGTTVWIY